MKNKQTKELSSLRHCTADLRICFSLNQTTGVTGLFHDATFTMPLISKIGKIAMHLQLMFQYLRSNCGSVVVWGVAILIWTPC